MFKQFTENMADNQVYLLLSLGIFLSFFIVVTVMLLRSRKAHNDYMSSMPLNDSLDKHDSTLYQ